MNTGDALLQAIIDEPNDDNLRLIYADWLHDHGEPERAEFIRLELAMHPHLLPGDIAPDPWDDPEYHRLHVRWDELVDRHSAADWFPALAPLVDRYNTLRGFVYWIKTSAKQFAEQADTIFANAPLLEEVSLTRLGRHVPAIAQLPELARIRSLNFFETTLGNAGLRQLCFSPHLASLRSLEAMSARIDTDGAQPLADSPLFARLEHLDLSANPIGDEGSQALFARRALPNLHHVELHDCGLGDDTIRSLTRAGGPANLRKLNLGINQCTAAGVERLARCPRLASLESLDLFGNPLGEGVLALAESPHLRSLRKLNLGLIEIDNAPIAALAPLLRSPNLAGVEDLELSSNDFTPEAREALATSDVLTRVRKFAFTPDRDHPEGMAALARATLPSLRHLDLSFGFLDPTSLRPLLDSPLLGQLTRLEIRGCYLDDASMEALAGADGLANLRILSLDDNQLGNAGALALARSPHLGQLTRLDLAQNTIGKRGRKALLDHFGETVCRFQSDEED
jgi:uncharacterized protein (TIGR02996 family)